MTTLQKVAALIFRLIGLCLILYSCFAFLSALLVMRGMAQMAIWILLPYLLGGIALFSAAIPLARILTRGIDE